MNVQRSIPVVIIISILLLSYCFPIINSIILISKKTLIIDEISNYIRIEYIYSQLSKPSISVEDENGKSYPMVINIYTALPNARLFYVGRVSGQGVAYLSKHVMDNFKRCGKEWISKRGGIKYFKAGTLLCIDILVKINSTAYKVYSILKSVPLSLELISKGYKPNIKIKIDLNKDKSTRIINLNKTKKPKEQKTQSNNNEIDEGCVILQCGEVFCHCYCSKWVLEKTHYTFQHKLVPIIMAAALYDYYPPPPEPIYIDLIYLYYKYTYTRNEWFKVFASAKITSLDKPELLLYNTYNKHEFEYGRNIYNSEFINATPSFKNDTIVAIGIYGSGLAGTYRKYEATGICGLIDDDDYTATDVTANITVFDIDAKYKNGIWTAEANLTKDDKINGEGWLEKYWYYLAANSELYETKIGTNTITYTYEGYRDKEVDLAIGLIGLMAAFLTETPEWADYFPFDVGIGWGTHETESAINHIYVETPTKYGTFTIYLKIYKTKTVYIYDENNYQLPTMSFYIRVERSD